MYSFPKIEPAVPCSMTGSDCCFLTCITVLQEAVKVVWYFHLFQNFPQFIVIHTVKGFFTSGAQSIGVSASASVLPMNTQDWSPLGWTGWISLHSKGLSRVFSNTTVQKHQFFGAQLSLALLTMPNPLTVWITINCGKF